MGSECRAEGEVPPRGRLAGQDLCCGDDPDPQRAPDVTVRLSPSVPELSRIADVNAGRVAPDLLLRNATVADVRRGVVLSGPRHIAIAGSRVAGISEDDSAWRAPDVPAIDCEGAFVLPGLVEAHTHLVKLGLQETAALQVRAGITTSVVDPNDLICRTGLSGFQYLLREAETAPGRILFWLPPCITLDPVRDAALDIEDWPALLDHPRVIGVGEGYWAELLRGHSRSLKLIAAARSRGLCIDGHAAGASAGHLNALIALGVDADHEAIDAEQARLRLRLGIFTLLRQGATRRDLAELAGVWRDPQISLDRVAFVTDGVGPEDLLAGHSLNAVVGDAGELGLAALTALRLATLNPARRLRLEPWIGTLDVGSLADIQIRSSIDAPVPDVVIVGGAVSQPAAVSSHSAAPRLTFKASVPEATEVSHPGAGTWRAIEVRQDAPLVTREVQTDGADACVLLAMSPSGDRLFRGLIRGYGIRTGAVATSATADSDCIIAVGCDPGNLRVAIRSVLEMEGGVAVADEGRVVARWVADIAGLLSSDAPARVAAGVSSVDRALRALGCLVPSGQQTLEFLCSPAIPHLRVSPSGYVRLKDGARLGLEWSA